MPEISVQTIDNETAIQFVKNHKTKDDYIIVKDHSKWYGCFFDSRLVSVCGVDYTKCGVSLHTGFTSHSDRKCGAYSAIVARIIDDYSDKIISGYFNKHNQIVPVKYGFHEIRILKNGTKLMRRDP